MKYKYKYIYILFKKNNFVKLCYKSKKFKHLKKIYIQHLSIFISNILLSFFNIIKIMISFTNYYQTYL